MIGFCFGGGVLVFLFLEGKGGMGSLVWGLGTWGSGREGRKGNEKGNWKGCLLGGFFFW